MRRSTSATTRTRCSRRESYNNVHGEPFQRTPGNGVLGLDTSEAVLLNTLTALGGPGYAAHFAPFFSVPGALPISGVDNLGLIGGDIRAFSPNATSYDRSDGTSSQWSAEMRFNSNFEGPINFLVAAYFLSTKTTGDYFVTANTLDYPSIVLGSLSGLADPGKCFAAGCMVGPSFYHNDGNLNTLTSKAVFGEVYWDVIPEELKFTGGLRWTEDNKYQRGRIALYSGLIPLGTTNEDQALAELVSEGEVDFDGSTAGVADVWQINRKKFDSITGRAVVNWTPHISEGDVTNFYASYSRGYKAGGFNPGVQPGLGVEPAYKPESIDAYEIGDKNTLFDGTLQANMDVWYYDYKNLQVSAIENNTSVNQNINAKLWGAEGEFNWAPDESWLFNFSFGTTQSSIENTSSSTTAIRPPAAATSCWSRTRRWAPMSARTACCTTAGAAPGTLPLGFGFFAPPGGVDSLAAHGVAHTSYGTCIAGNTVIDGFGRTFEEALNDQGFSTEDPTHHGNHSGAFVNLDGNELQNTPKYTLSVGAQYTAQLGDGYNVVARVDYYWQDKMWGRIFNGPADAIESWDVTNAVLTLNGPDKAWYVQGFIQNIFDNTNETGMYLTSSTSGLYTNGSSAIRGPTHPGRRPLLKSAAPPKMGAPGNRRPFSLERGHAEAPSRNLSHRSLRCGAGLQQFRRPRHRGVAPGGRARPGGRDRLPRHRRHLRQPRRLGEPARRDPRGPAQGGRARDQVRLADGRRRRQGARLARLYRGRGRGQPEAPQDRLDRSLPAPHARPEDADGGDAARARRIGEIRQGARRRLLQSGGRGHRRGAGDRPRERSRRLRHPRRTNTACWCAARRAR